MAPLMPKLNSQAVLCLVQGKDSYNLFEGVDFDQLSGEPLEYAQAAFRGSLIDGITILTTTEDDDSSLVKDHKDICHRFN